MYNCRGGQLVALSHKSATEASNGATGGWGILWYIYNNGKMVNFKPLHFVKSVFANVASKAWLGVKSNCHNYYVSDPVIRRSSSR